MLLRPAASGRVDDRAPGGADNTDRRLYPMVLIVDAIAAAPLSRAVLSVGVADPPWRLWMTTSQSPRAHMLLGGVLDLAPVGNGPFRLAAFGRGQSAGHSRAAPGADRWL